MLTWRGPSHHVQTLKVKVQRIPSRPPERSGWVTVAVVADVVLDVTAAVHVIAAGEVLRVGNSPGNILVMVRIPKCVTSDSFPVMMSV